MTNPSRNRTRGFIAGGTKAVVVIFIFAGYFAALADIALA